jgi:RHS repeat-associated protein
VFKCRLHGWDTLLEAHPENLFSKLPLAVLAPKSTSTSTGNAWPGGMFPAAHYYFADYLGSASVVTNAAGTTPFDEDLDYYPYGGIVAPSTDAVPQHFKFTGKERDSESNLDYFGARYYGSNMGRFIQPDLLYLEFHRLGDPQQLNLYTYGRNNPLKFIDPLGLDIACSGPRCDDYLKALQKDVSFKVKYDKNGKVVAEVDKDKKLSKSDKAFLKAIRDTKDHVTINAVGGKQDSSLFFGASHGSTHTINFDEAALLDSPKNAGGYTSAQLVGHETLEGYDESKGHTISEGHDYATRLRFPGLDPSRITGLFGDAQTGTAYGFTQQFQVHGTGTTENIRINFATPIPAASVHSGMNAAGYPVSVEKAQ